MNKTTIPTIDCDRSNKREECGIFQPFGLIGAIFTREIEYRISVANAGFNKKMAVFAESWSKNLRNKSMKWYICGIGFCCVETCTFRGVDHTEWNGLKCGAGERIEGYLD